MNSPALKSFEQRLFVHAGEYNIAHTYQLLMQSAKVSSVLSEIVNKIPENKLPIVVERLNAMIKML